jgi:hypothetical protein
MKNGSTYYELKLIILLHCPDHVVSLLSSSLKFSSLSHDSSFICLSRRRRLSSLHSRCFQSRGLAICVRASCIADLRRSAISWSCVVTCWNYVATCWNYDMIADMNPFRITRMLPKIPLNTLCYALQLIKCL